MLKVRSMKTLLKTSKKQFGVIYQCIGASNILKVKGLYRYKAINISKNIAAHRRDIHITKSKGDNNATPTQRRYRASVKDQSR